MIKERDAVVADRVHRTADGLRIHYRDYAPSGAPEELGRAHAPIPVVCLHGLTRNARDFEGVAPLIAELGHRVIAPSLRGRGRSDWSPDPLSYHPGTYAADVASLLDAIGVERAAFVGTSLGGIVTMVLAAAAPGRVAACVLNDIGAELAPEGLARIRGYVGDAPPVSDWAEAAERARAINAAAFPSRTDPSFWLDFARRTYVEKDGEIVPDYDPAIATLARAGPDAPEALWPFFDALAATPTLLIRGALSDLLTPEIVAAMRARKPDLRVVEIPEVGHAPLLTEPAALAAVAGLLGSLD